VPGLWEDITDGFGHRTYDKLNETDLIAPTRPRRYRRLGASFMLEVMITINSLESTWPTFGSQTLGENITGITTKAPGKPRRAPASWAYSPSLGRSTLAPGCLALSPHRPVGHGDGQRGGRFGTTGTMWLPSGKLT